MRGVACGAAAAALAGLLTAGNAPAIGAEVTASFIDGTYVIDGENRCDKLAKLDAGTKANVETVPETLTKDGFQSWEGECSFVSITEKQPGKVYAAKMACVEDDAETEETDTFTLDPKDHSIAVTVEDKTTKFVRCDGAKGP